MVASACSWALLLALCVFAAPVYGGPAVKQRHVDGLARVQYDLWHGDHPIRPNRRTLSLLVPDGTPFYNVMILAANISSAYRFEAETVDGAKYVNCIGGWKKNEEEKNLWMFYKLHARPNPATPPPDIMLTAKGINGVFISDGDIYLFWFKHVTWA